MHKKYKKICQQRQQEVNIFYAAAAVNTALNLPEGGASRMSGNHSGCKKKKKSVWIKVSSQHT